MATMTRTELVDKLTGWRDMFLRNNRGPIQLEASDNAELADLIGEAGDALGQGEAALGELQVYAWSENCGRQGTIGGLVVVNGEERAIIDRLCDECAVVRLGEVLGKHSDISVDLHPGFFQVLDVPHEAASALCGYADDFGTPILGAMMDLYDDEYADEDEGLDDLGDDEFDDEDFEDDDEDEDEDDF